MGSDDENVVQFRHRMTNGVINTHGNPEPDMISKDMLFARISSALNNGEQDKIGHCWKPECTAVIYPQELNIIIHSSDYSEGPVGQTQKNADILTYERYDFNKKYSV